MTPADTQLGFYQALTAMMIPISAILTYIAAMLKSKAGDNTQAKLVAEQITKFGLLINRGHTWLVDNQARILKMVEVIECLSPESKKALESQGVNIQAWTEEMRKMKTELDIINRDVLGTTETKSLADQLKP